MHRVFLYGRAPLLSLLFALGAALSTAACKKSLPAQDAGVKALASANGQTLLFALSLADASDVTSLREQMAAAGADLGLPNRPLPFCFYRATGLTSEDRAAIGANVASFTSLPRSLLETKVQALRRYALDPYQANTLVDALAAEEGLSDEAVEALFSTEIVAGRDVGVDDAKLSRLASGLATRSPEPPRADVSDVPCDVNTLVALLDGKPVPEAAENGASPPAQSGSVTLRTSGAAPTLELMKFTPLQRRGINILVPLFLMATNTAKIGVPTFTTVKGNAAFAQQIAQVSKTGNRIAFANHARQIPPLRAPPPP